jgi:hypothetical protein
MPLKLVSGQKNRPTGEWAADDYDVVDEESGKSIGRIMRTHTTQTSGEPWFWGIDFSYKHDRDRYYGRAETREAAMKAFRECWDIVPNRISCLKPCASP